MWKIGLLGSILIYFRSSILGFTKNFYVNNTLVEGSVEIPEDLEGIKLFALCGLTSLQSISIPKSVKKIGGGAFAQTGLIEVEIPDNVISLGAGAFSGCDNLKKVRLGKGIEEIGSEAFDDCKQLDEVYVSWTTPAGVKIEKKIFDDVYLITLYVPYGCKDNYVSRTPWNDFKEILEYAPEGEGDEPCAAPRIYIEGNELSFYSSTPNAKYYYKIDCKDNASLTSSEDGYVSLSATYEISVYAYADGYQNSEVVTATLIWIDPTIVFDDGIYNMEAKKAVLIRSNSNSVVVSGTEHGEKIELYDLSGMLLGSKVANDKETIIPCNRQKGEIIVVKNGDKAVKCRL